MPFQSSTCQSNVSMAQGRPAALPLQGERGKWCPLTTSAVRAGHCFVTHGWSLPQKKEPKTPKTSTAPKEPKRTSGRVRRIHNTRVTSQEPDNRDNSKEKPVTPRQRRSWNSDVFKMASRHRIYTRPEKHTHTQSHSASFSDPSRCFQNSRKTESRPVSHWPKHTSN